MTTLLLGNLNYSSWSIRAALVARMSKLDIELKIMPLATDATREYLAEHTGYKQVPVLIDGDLIIRDSLAITEWIAEACDPGAVWPADSHDRARARMVVAEMHSSFAALRSECYVDIRSRRPDTELSQQALADVDRVQALWAECIQHKCQDGPYLFGNWSAVDAFYAPVVTRFRTYDVTLDALSDAYAAAVFNHPHMVELETAAKAEPWQMVQGLTGMEYVGSQER